MTDAIPMLDLAAQHEPLRKQISAAIERVIDQQAYILGPDVADFEREMAAYLGAKHAIGCANGSDALVLALKALDVGRDDEVITTTFSFFATAGAIARVGAKPVFVDIDPETYNLDPALIPAKVTSRTKAIMPVHLFGQMTPMAPIMDLAKKHGLKVVEDGAQAVGSKENGKSACTIGHIGTLSFFPSKNLGCFGDGGMVVTEDDQLADRLKRLRVHGTGKVRYHYDEVGLNSRLDTIQAAILRIKLPHLDAWTEGRQRNADRYDQLLSDVKQVVRPRRLPGMRHIYNQYTIRVPRRDELLERFKAEKIGAAVYYPLPLHEQKCFEYVGFKPGDCPRAEVAAREVLSIPIYGELTEAQIQRIVGVIKQHVAG
ncbi:MAG: DegT/DnrJ/EryC1/StrS family aminotransferase [Deltaproteobacteria bacterium]|nr:DegT/DnrJ/EryC1/StrS family aminotransferase [Deltaproteobacteria bacterium]